MVSKLTAVVAVFVLCLMVVAAEHPGHDALCPSTEMTSGPPIADTLVTSHLTVDGSGIELCSMEYRVPAKATMYQGMLAASQQHGNSFKFESEAHPMWGHFVSSINDVGSEGGFYWFIFDKDTLKTTPVGVDFIDIADNSSYIWHYSNSSQPNTTYSGPCVGSSVIPPPMPLTFKVGYLSVSSANTDLFAVCKQPVLLPTTPTTVYALVDLANDQIPLFVQAVLHAPQKTVTSLDGLANDDRYAWTGYRAGSNEKIPYDLSLTAISDGDHIEFRYDERSEPMIPADNGDLCPGEELTSGPTITDTLVTSYLSVDGGGTVQCSMKYRVPAKSTVYQGMLAASQQHGNGFEFESTLYAKFGHFITSINSVAPMGGSYWLIFDDVTKMLTPVGVDSIHVKNGSSYIWHYTNDTGHNVTYRGPCVGSSFIPPTIPLTYKVVYLTISGANVHQTTNDTFKRVCKQTVLIPSKETSVFRLLEIANSQIPITVKAELDLQGSSVRSFNGVSMRRSYRWIGFKAGMDGPIPYDLSMSTVTDGDHIEFRYEEVEIVTGPRGGASSAGQSVALVTLAVLLVNVVTSL
ncbi:uncharacterized protein LOC119719559 [Patiria miniata]|uniref:DUF4430 domain-containing protein n=1 Tax=Patiria miniata TaxID=46514 RepID=A0A913YZF5_PATMI|nr:uncharacterized protein LOC119719559 [Patiria miniata]